MQDETCSARTATPAYDPAGDPQEFWDSVYGNAGERWSGRVNSHLTELAATLEPGRALDLGCGQGGDAIWLAQHGWQVVAADVASGALQRADDRARELHVDNAIDFQRHDLGESFPAGMFDLVSAHYLHSPVRLHRPQILRRAADAVAPDGILLIVDHGSAAPWSWDIPEHRFLAPDEVLESLGLAEEQWDRLRRDIVEKQATGPGGQVATVTDHVIAVRRRRRQARSTRTG